MKRILITGAAGNLGRLFRERMRDRAELLRLSDIDPIDDAAAHEECVQCDLSDSAAVEDLVEGCDAVLHFGGVSTEQTFEPILQANIVGAFNLYEAARRHGQPRIMFASSNHVTGFHPVTSVLDAMSPMRPDGLYGVSKCFGEALARMYFDKFGQETLIVRIGSCFPEPRDHRMLTTWLGAEDFVALVDRMFEVPVLGCPVVYGASRNGAQWWDNRHAGYLGWQPAQSSEPWRERLAAEGRREADAEVHRYQGGAFCSREQHKG